MAGLHCLGVRHSVAAGQVVLMQRSASKSAYCRTHCFDEGLFYMITQVPDRFLYVVFGHVSCVSLAAGGVILPVPAFFTRLSGTAQDKEAV